MGVGEVGIWIALAAGFVSLISPCVLALVPVYLTYLSGVSLQGGPPGSAGSGRSVGAPLAHGAAGSAQSGGSTGLTGTGTVSGGFWSGDQPKVMVNALLFVAGFSIVFVAFGASASAVGSRLLDYQLVIRKVAGILVVAMGLHTMGLLQIPFLDREARLRFGAGTAPNPGRSGLIGMAFAAGWTPCVGPTLAAILGMAASSQKIGEGVLLLSAYSLGMGIPFLILALFMNRLSGFLTALRRRAKLVSVITGLLMVGIGLMIYTNFFLTLSRYFNFASWGL